MRFTWDEKRRHKLLADRGLDLSSVGKVFERATFTWEDSRFPAGKRRFITLGLLGAEAIVVSHTESDEHIHAISMINRSDLEEPSEDPNDPPPVTQDEIDRAVFRMGGQLVAPAPEGGKVPVQMMLDAGTVQYFKNRAGGRGFDRLISEALEEYIQNHDVADVVRRVMREEIRRSA